MRQTLRAILALASELMSGPIISGDLISGLPDGALAQQVCLLLRQAADRFILPRWQQLASTEIQTKSSATDFVTIADIEAERWLTPELEKLVPGAIVVGEEACSDQPDLREKSADGLVWTLDPVDGTRNFVQQRPHFCSMIALARDGIGLAAWIWLPLEQACLYAAPAQGLFWLRPDADPKPLALPGHRRGLDQMTGSGGVLGLPAELQDRVRARLKQLPGRQFIGSAGIEAVRMASAKQDYLFHGRCNPWDHFPVDIICRTAGMIVRHLPEDSGYDPLLRSALLVAPDRPSWQALADHIWPADG